MFISVRLDNYITLPYTIIFVLPSVITHASISGCSLCVLDNNLMGKTLNEKIFGRRNSLKKKLKILLGKNKFQEKHLEGIGEVTNIRNEKFSD